MSKLHEPTAAAQATRLCAHCSEPIPLLRTFAANDEDLCPDCDEAQFERDRQAAWESHLEDLAEERAMDRAYYGRD